MPKRDKFNKDRKFKRSHYRAKGDEPGQVEFEDTAPKDQKAEYGIKKGEYSPGFHKRAYKDLVFGQVSVKVNPTDEAGELADPYAIIGPVNKVIDANYYGEDNTSGSVCPQLALGSKSNFLNVADIISMEVAVNYNYCKHIASDNATPLANKAYYYPWADIDSSIQAEAFYDLPFFKWKVKAGSTTYYPDGLLDVVDFYQIVLQATYQIPLRYKVLRSLEKELKDMCYQKGASILNDIYSRLKKKTLVGTIDGVSEAISTHFVDTKWFEEVSLLLAQPCKKAVGMLDPLMELKVKYNYNNNLTVQDENGTDLFSTSSSDYTTLFADINTVLDKLSIQTVVGLARTNANYNNIQTWMNTIVDKVAEIKNKLEIFTTHFQDLVVAFKRMSKAGYTNWQVGQFLLIDSIQENFKPVFNKMVFDIIRSSYTGGAEIVYDTTINQWKSLTVWDKYLGIPTYDQKSGGSVITFSTKTVINNSGLELSYPAWFSTVNCVVMTRKGQTYNITKLDQVVNSGAIARVLGRLLPLSTFDSAKIHIPAVDISALSANPAEQAWITEAIQHVFGYLRVTVAANTYNYCISDDILTCVDFVVSDLTNAMDSQGRLNAPFRVLKAVTKPVLGLSRS